MEEETGLSGNGNISNRRASEVSLRACSVLSSSSAEFNSQAPGSASPSNLPLSVAPPKPGRVVASESDDDDSTSTRGRGRKLLDSESHSSRHVRSKSVLRIGELSDEILLEVFSFLVESNEFLVSVYVVSKHWNNLANRPELWERLRATENGKINKRAFKYLGLKNKGTEGLCYKVYHRASQQVYAMKKARVYPEGEGVPYYMLRELAFLQGLCHPHIATMEHIALANNELYVFFKFVEYSLFDLINPSNDPSGGLALPPELTKRCLYQVLQGVAFCHERGVLHRNLKPKHLLVDMPHLDLDFDDDDEDDDQNHPQETNESNQSSETEGAEYGLSNPRTRGSGLGLKIKRQGSSHCSNVGGIPAMENPTGALETTWKPYSAKKPLRRASGSKTIKQAKRHAKLLEHAVRHASIKISDFALVRSTSIPLRSYTTEVVTLWYRAPEVLMGGQYFSSVDIWSVGCVFAELVLGKPLFPGICEVDQLFQIFNKLGTPDDSTWEGFSSLPNFGFNFPNWKRRPLEHLFPGLDSAGIDLLSRMLCVNPSRRITAEDALRHRYFDSIREAEERSSKLTLTKMNSINGKGERAGIGASREYSIRMEKKKKRPRSSCLTNSLNLSLAAQAEQAGLRVSCWKWAREAARSTGTRKRSGLADPAYLVKYYEYLKDLESQLFPLQDYLERASLGNGRTNPAVEGTATTNGVTSAAAAANRFQLGQGLRNGRAIVNEGETINDIVVDAGNNHGRQAGHEAGFRTTGTTNAENTEHELHRNPIIPPVGLQTPGQEQQQQQQQRDLQPVHRAMLVDWLVEVIDVFEMSLRSVFLAVNYTDRYLSLQPVERRRFQLLGATCLHIASKCEDVSYIGVDDLVVCADRVYDGDDVLKLEEKVLNTLNFRLAVPTVIDFLNAFYERLQYSDEEDTRLLSKIDGSPVSPEKRPPLMPVKTRSLFLARYIAELSLQERYFISKLPSMVAASCLVLGMHYNEQTVYNSRIKATTGFSLIDLRPCIIELRRAHLEAPTIPSLTVIRKRYERPAMLSVAEIDPVPLSLIDWREEGQEADDSGRRGRKKSKKSI